MKLVTVEQMQTLERRAREAGIDEAALMEQAGLAVAQEAMISAGTVEERIFLVLAGGGNNGSDGLVAARHLLEWEVGVHVYLLTARAGDDPTYRAATEAGIPCTVTTDDPNRARLDELLGESACVIDALLGTGGNRPIGGEIASILTHLAAARSRPVVRPRLVACDLPSGVDADTGAVDPLTVEPDVTVAFGHPKIGTYVTPGALVCGEVIRVDIGIPAAASDDLPYEDISLPRLKPLMPERPADSHKGTFGRATLAGGSQRYPGALRLAGEAAARVGTGLVELAAPGEIQAMLAAGFPDAIHLPLPAADGALDEAAARVLLREAATTDALLVGPGLSLSNGTHAFVRALLAGWDAAAGETCIVWDADALSVLANIDGWWEQCTAPQVLTPHPGEMARLLGITRDEVQRARIPVATAYAQRTGAVVVLKGACTVIAAPDGQARLTNLATSALAHAGTGDVLAGMLAGFVAQGMAPFDAATAAVYLHGECGRIVGRALGHPSALAQDLVRALPDARKVMDPERD